MIILQSFILFFALLFTGCYGAYLRAGKQDGAEQTAFLAAIQWAILFYLLRGFND